MLVSRHPRAAAAHLVLAPDVRAAAAAGDKAAAATWKLFQAGLAALDTKPAKALESFDAAIKKSARFVDGHFCVALALLATAKPAEAIATLGGLAQTLPGLDLEAASAKDKAADPLIGILARVFNNIGVAYLRDDPKVTARAREMFDAALACEEKLPEAVANRRALGKKSK